MTLVQAPGTLPDATRSGPSRAVARCLAALLVAGSLAGSVACAAPEDGELAAGLSGVAASSSPAGELRWSTVLIPPPGPVDPAAGRELFLARCTGCHGLDGRGDGPAAHLMGAPPRDFADGLYKLRSGTGFPSDEDLFRTITAGIRRAGMPAMDHLSPDDRWQLVAEVQRLGRVGFVRDELDEFTSDEGLPALGEIDAVDAGALLDGGVGDEWPAELRAAVDDEDLVELELDLAESLADLTDTGERVDLGAPPAPTAALLEQGRELYTRWGCAACHGEQGRADGPASSTLTNARGGHIPTLDLTSGASVYKGGGRAEDVARVLATGMAGTPMPSYRLGVESDADIWALAHWVVTLQRAER
jgi:cytochrome c oxidase cbb3-type subunit 2